MNFKAKIEKVESKGGWHYVLIPINIYQELKSQVQRSTVPVVVRLGGSKWTTTIMSMGNQKWFVAIKAGIRRKENINKGDEVDINIGLDEARL